MDRSQAKQCAKELLKQMTVEEKIAQMVQVSYADVTREEALQWAKRGAGSFLHVLGDNAREIQKAAGQSRLGIPVIFGIDAIHGHGLNDHATIFPSQLASACGWDPESVRRMGEVTAREVATDGLHWTFSPVLCLGRDTRWGRVDETFGEDPYLAGELGAAIVRGYQGDDLADDEHILACAKHYLGYGEATGGRDSYDTEVTERKIREVFLPPFRKAVEAGCATIMTAYGSIDGVPLTASRRLMHDILRDELGFDGFVVTDWDNMNNLRNRQMVSTDLSDAAVKTANAGNDMIMVSLEFYEAMLQAVQEGKADMASIDEAVTHILTIKYEMGLFEKPEKTGKPGCFGCEEHTPVRPYVTLWEGIRAICERRGIEAVYEKGCSVLPDDKDDLEAAVRAASSADVIVYAVGDVIAQFGETHDRADLNLSGRQYELFRRLKETGKPVCTVLIASKPLCLNETAEQADAVLCGFNGGMFGGQALAEAIFGELNPSGRLPISFPRHSGQLPVYYSQLPGWHGGKYCDLPDSPLYAFGEGMGFSAFTYSGLTVDDDLLLTVDVTNTGKTAGKETIQVYFRDDVSSLVTPVRRLIAFTQADLMPGETRRVSIQLNKESFALIDQNCEAVVEPGTFTVYAGHSSKEEDLLSTSIVL